jgi:ketosteroid isomerase-like protein
MNNKMILQTANEAVAKGDYEGFLAFCSEDTKWIFVGDQILDGKEAVRQYMKENYLEPPKFTVENVIADGDFVTVMGQISLKNKDGSDTHFDYCDNWHFENGKIAALKAYVVEKKNIDN